jgi:hypothetical protein
VTKKTLLIVVLLLQFSCRDKVDFEYSTGLNSYLNEVFNFELRDIEVEVSVFLYLEYCKSCVTDALTLMDTMEVGRKDIKLYFIGDESVYPENQGMISSLKRTYEYLIDSESLHYSFATGINEPLILKIKSGKVVEYSYINTATFRESWRILNTN